MDTITINPQTGQRITRTIGFIEADRFPAIYQAFIIGEDKSEDVLIGLAQSKGEVLLGTAGAVNDTVYQWSSPFTPTPPPVPADKAIIFIPIAEARLMAEASKIGAPFRSFTVLDGFDEYLDGE